MHFAIVIPFVGAVIRPEPPSSPTSSDVRQRLAGKREVIQRGLVVSADVHRAGHHQRSMGNGECRRSLGEVGLWVEVSSELCSGMKVVTIASTPTSKFFQKPRWSGVVRGPMFTGAIMRRRLEISDQK
ncbi:hypothetical protein FA13DRAFT_1718553 [Coprinellus micaceus]|uniref:Uncharacterized protein n=1 Tax=Coprinellus micaceus TaxID=71717 RepID=A0A4Y7SDA4_COPMI|nr:hypothetical protein FA13DRAFT_1718553 [Coprinellus micaceus]